MCTRSGKKPKCVTGMSHGACPYWRSIRPKRLVRRCLDDALTRAQKSDPHAFRGRNLALDPLCHSARPQVLADDMWDLLRPSAVPPPPMSHDSDTPISVSPLGVCPGSSLPCVASRFERLRLRITK